MGSILSGYTVMQQNDWAGRRFFTAREARSGQVVYLVAEPVGGPLEPYWHPTLPPLEPIALEGDTRWLAGQLPQGETLEDLRPTLTEGDIVSAVLSVVDALTSLSALQPPPVPSYIDPACIKRDQQGRWLLDYLALAHAPEARMGGQPPPGVHPFGVLLYWLFTGETVRRARVQIHKVGPGLPSGLQFILIRCLGRSYPSLAELRSDLVRAGNEHEFRPVAQQAPRRTGAAPVKTQDLPGRPPAAAETVLTDIPVVPLSHGEPSPVAGRRPEGLERHRVPLGGPNIPINDRPWALPQRPPDGFRKFVVPPEPNPKAVRRTRYGLVGAGGLVAALLVAVIGWQAGFLPVRAKPVVRRPEFAQTDVQVGAELPPPPAPPGPGRAPSTPELTPGPLPGQQPQQPGAEKAPAEQTPTPEPARPTNPAQGTPATPPRTTTPATPATPGRQQPTTPARPVQPPQQVPAQPTAPTRPARPPLEPGTVDFQDAGDGGLPVLVHYNNRSMGWAYIIPHPTSPYVSLPTFNRLFGRSVLWVPQDNASIRLFTNDLSVVTADYTMVRGRLWLKLTPSLQQALGVQVNAYSEGGMYFTSQ